MQMELLSAIFSGGMSGIAYWVVGMPPDVLKSRLQTGALKYIYSSHILYICMYVKNEIQSLLLPI